MVNQPERRTSMTASMSCSSSRRSNSGTSGNVPVARIRLRSLADARGRALADTGGMVRTAVILAGGRGSRLAPYTTVIPKPLLPVGERAILEIGLQQLGAAGVQDVVMAVGHLAHLVEAVIGDGSRYGLRIRYHRE